MFLKGDKCELRALEESDDEARAFTKAVNAGLTTRHMLTGSYPMRVIDCQRAWREERERGSVQFGVWLPFRPQVKKYGETREQDSIVTPAERERFIGTCGLYSHRDIYRSWELRILIFEPDALGHGIGTEAVRLLIGYAFERLNAHRVWLGVNSENVGAIKCYEKCGFTREGVLREELFCHGKYVDAVRYGILEQEWRALAAEA